jgi:hypothetical protein
MPLSRDPLGGGTEADGARSAMYCSHCYRSGKFTQPGITAAKMQDFVRVKLEEMRVPGFLRYFFVKGIPKMKRWSAGV